MRATSGRLLRRRVAGFYSAVDMRLHLLSVHAEPASLRSGYAELGHLGTCCCRDRGICLLQRRHALHEMAGDPIHLGLWPLGPHI